MNEKVKQLRIMTLAAGCVVIAGSGFLCGCESQKKDDADAGAVVAGAAETQQGDGIILSPSFRVPPQYVGKLIAAGDDDEKWSITEELFQDPSYVTPRTQNLSPEERIRRKMMSHEFIVDVWIKYFPGIFQRLDWHPGHLSTFGRWFPGKPSTQTIRINRGGTVVDCVIERDDVSNRRMILKCLTGESFTDSQSFLKWYDTNINHLAWNRRIRRFEVTLTDIAPEDRRIAIGMKRSVVDFRLVQFAHGRRGIISQLIMPMDRKMRAIPDLYRMPGNVVVYISSYGPVGATDGDLTIGRIRMCRVKRDDDESSKWLLSSMDDYMDPAVEVFLSTDGVVSFIPHKGSEARPASSLKIASPR